MLVVSGHLLHDIRSLEAIQRRAAKMVTNVRNMRTLTGQRNSGYLLLIQVCVLLNGTDHIANLDNRLRVDYNSTTGGNAKKVPKQHWKIKRMVTTF